MNSVRAAILVLALPSLGYAQGRFFVQSGALVDIRSTPTFDIEPVFRNGQTTITYVWNDRNGDRLWQPGEESDPIVGVIPPTETHQTLGRVAPGGSLAVGAFVTPALSIRIETSFQRGQASTAEPTATAHRSSTTPDLYKETISTADVSFYAGWQHGEVGRLSVTYLGGVVVRRRQQLIAQTRSGTTITMVNGLAALVPVVREEVDSLTTHGTGVMAGLDFAVAISRHLAIVQQVRLVAATGDWNFRPAVTMRWRP